MALALVLSVAGSVLASINSTSFCAAARAPDFDRRLLDLQPVVRFRSSSLWRALSMVLLRFWSAQPRAVVAAAQADGT